MDEGQVVGLPEVAAPASRQPHRRCFTPLLRVKERAPPRPRIPQPPAHLVRAAEEHLLPGGGVVLGLPLDEPVHEIRVHRAEALHLRRVGRWDWRRRASAVGGGLAAGPGGGVARGGG